MIQFQSFIGLIRHHGLGAKSMVREHVSFSGIFLSIFL